jgi:myosin-crossreactive antigen
MVERPRMLGPVRCARTKSRQTTNSFGSLAGAAFLIRDAHLPEHAITIYEALSVFGGSLAGAQLPRT